MPKIHQRAFDPSPRGDAFRQIAKARSEARQREIQEGAQFDRHETIWRVYKADG